jgi:hypothetical protein
VTRQRFIHPEIWTDPDVGRLHPTARLFFIGCFSNADDEGRLPGSPAYLRNVIFPYDDISLDKVQTIRDEAVAACKNLVLYTVDGAEYMAFTKWARWQNPRYAKPSKLPPPQLEVADTLQRPCNQIAAKSPQDGADIAAALQPSVAMGCGSGSGLGSDSDLGCGLGCDEPPPSRSGEQEPPDITAIERLILHELRQVAGYPFEWQRDLEHVRLLMVEFPTLDIAAEAKSWRTYKLDKPLAAKSNPRSQFRNWLMKARDFGRRRTPEPQPALPDRGNALDRYERENAEKAGDRS